MSVSEGESSALSRREFMVAGAIPLVSAVESARSGRSSDRRPGTSATPRRSSRQETVRVGLIGAGSNVQRVQIPGFRAIPECEIIAVANRSLESSQEVADAFGIPRAYVHWGELIDDPDVDAILIGTWPYMHHALTLAGLESGKHVLCQARMANDAREAREMLAASRAHPDLITQLVPTSTSYTIDNVIRRLTSDGTLGRLLSVEIQRLQSGFADFEGELDWRHDREFSGYNTMNLGSTYESMIRWLGRATRVVAMSQTHVARRRDREGTLTSVTLPDHVDVLCELAGGAQAHMRFSETTGLSNGNQTWIYGSEGTIYVDDAGDVFAGRRGDTQLSPVPNPPSEQAYYRVEEEFVNAIRGLEEVTMLPFEAGVHYMEWTEAVHRSAGSGEAVDLPL